MGVFTGILIAFGVLLVVLSSRSLTTFVHELGHTIPALLFTDDRVTMMVGSYGDVEKCLHLKLGRLDLLLKFNIINWYCGFCSHGPIRGFGKNMAVLAGGPVFSLLLSMGLLLWIISSDFSDGQITLISIFVLSAFWDFCVNIFPRNQGLPMDDGSITYNDGYQILRLFRSAKQTAKFHEAQELTRQNKPAAAIALLTTALEEKPDRFAAESLLDLLIKENRIQEGLDIFTEHIRPLKRKDRDFLNLAKLYHADNNEHEALRSVNQYLYKNWTDPGAALLRAEIYLDLDNYELAQVDLQNVLGNAPNQHDAMVYLAYVLTKTERISAAKELIDHGLPYLEKHPRAQFYAGYYYYKLDKKDLAIKHLNKSKSLGWTHYGLEHFIHEAEQL